MPFRVLSPHAQLELNIKPDANATEAKLAAAKHENVEESATHESSIIKPGELQVRQAVSTAPPARHSPAHFCPYHHHTAQPLRPAATLTSPRPLTAAVGVAHSGLSTHVLIATARSHALASMH